MRRHQPAYAALASIGLIFASLSSVAIPSHAAAPANGTADVTSRPDQMSAMLAAEVVGHRVEITDDRTASTSTFANADGTLTTESYAGPVRVRMGGAWVPVDTTLQEKNGIVSPVAAPAT